MEIVIIFFKPQPFISKGLNEKNANNNKKTKQRLNSDPVKYLLSIYCQIFIDQGHWLNRPKIWGGLLQRYYSISHYYEHLALILDFSQLLVCVKGQFQIWKYRTDGQGTECKGTFPHHIFPVNRTWMEVKTWFLLSEVLGQLLCGLNQGTKPHNQTEILVRVSGEEEKCSRRKEGAHEWVRRQTQLFLHPEFNPFSITEFKLFRF